MTRGPRRLLEDPDFKWETGCDLADERLLVGNYDTAAMKQRLLDTIAAGGAGAAAGAAGSVGDGVPAVRAGLGWGAVVKPIGAVVAAVAVVAGSFWAGVQVARTSDVAAPAAIEAPVAAPIVAPAPVETPAVRERPVEAAPVAPSAAPVAEPIELPVVRVSPPARERAAPVAAPSVATPPIAEAPLVVAAPVETPAEAVADAPSDDAVAALAPEEPPAPASDLPRQNAAFESAIAALKDGDHAVARDRLEAYLANWPTGAYRQEAKLSLLQALHGIGDPAAVEQYAAAIANDPGLSIHRDEILRLRAESLVKLERCGEALLVAEEISTRASADIRRACRQIRREEP